MDSCQVYHIMHFWEEKGCYIFLVDSATELTRSQICNKTCMGEEEEEFWSPARPDFLKYLTPALVEVLTYPVLHGKEKQFVMLKILPDAE